MPRDVGDRPNGPQRIGIDVRGPVESTSAPRLVTPSPPGSGCSVSSLDPLGDTRWDDTLSRFADATVFHTSAWARVLADTYGHRPVYLCVSSDREVRGLLPLMEVRFLARGKHGISLPFTDCCAPLSMDAAGGEELFAAAVAQARERGWRTLECRGGIPQWPGATPSVSFLGHELNLDVSSATLHANLHPSLRRSIHKAQREGVVVEFREDLESMRTYYELHCQTRRRHGAPPQPFRFFANIVKHMTTKGKGFIALAKVHSVAVAGGVFLRHGTQAVYKFGASNFAYQQLRANNLVMWQSILRLVEAGATRLDFGRTSCGNEGLRRFKMSFGATEHPICYAQYDFRKGVFVMGADRAEPSWINALFRLMPLPVLRLAGRAIYPHMS